MPDSPTARAEERYTPAEQAAYTPTDKDMEQHFLWGDFPFLTGPGQRGEMWGRWLTAHDAEVVAQERAAVVAWLALIVREEAFPDGLADIYRGIAADISLGLHHEDLARQALERGEHLPTKEERA